MPVTVGQKKSHVFALDNLQKLDPTLATFISNKIDATAIRISHPSRTDVHPRKRARTSNDNPSSSQTNRPTIVAADRNSAIVRAQKGKYRDELQAASAGRP